MRRSIKRGKRGLAGASGGLKLNIGKLIGRGGINRDRAIVGCPVTTEEVIVRRSADLSCRSRLDASGVGLRGSFGLSSLQRRDISEAGNGISFVRRRRASVL